MAKANFDVDFTDGEEKQMSDKEREHMITDIIHKLFVISSFHHHHKALKKKQDKKG